VKYAELELHPEDYGNGTCYYLQTRDWGLHNMDTRIWTPDQNGNYVPLDDDGGREPGNTTRNYYSSEAVVWIMAGHNYDVKVRIAAYSPYYNTASFQLLLGIGTATSEAACANFIGFYGPLATAAYTDTGVRFYRAN
jgi:hypothetical protein